MESRHIAVFTWRIRNLERSNTNNCTRHQRWIFHYKEDNCCNLVLGGRKDNYLSINVRIPHNQINSRKCQQRYPHSDAKRNTFTETTLITFVIAWSIRLSNSFTGVPLCRAKEPQRFKHRRTAYDRRSGLWRRGSRGKIRRGRIGQQPNSDRNFNPIYARWSQPRFTNADGE